MRSCGVECVSISTHAPLAGRDPSTRGRKAWREQFQPTRPLRGATINARHFLRKANISTHAPLAGRDHGRVRIFERAQEFQPTRPLRGATFSPCSGRKLDRDFNPRAPCGARQSQSRRDRAGRCISTHAPLAGRDVEKRRAVVAVDLFQPTRPLRGATKRISEPIHNRSISTHAPLAGRDEAQQRQGKGEKKFQPTRPLRGATVHRTVDHGSNVYFNPRAPCGARRM